MGSLPLAPPGKAQSFLKDYPLTPKPHLPLLALLLSHVQLFAMTWPVACQTPLSMEYPKQDYWSGLPCPFPRDLPDPGIAPKSPVAPALQADP